MRLSDIDNFKLYLDRFGIEHRPGKGEWQVLQVITPDAGWQVIHKNKHGQIIISDKLQDLVIGFKE